MRFLVVRVLFTLLITPVVMALLALAVVFGPLAAVWWFSGGLQEAKRRTRTMSQVELLTRQAEARMAQAEFAGRRSSDGR